MAEQFIRTQRDGRLTIITMNRPEVMNALHPPASREFLAAIEAFEADDEQWVAIITGAGDRAFSTGNDLKFQAEHGAQALTIPAPSGTSFHARHGLTKPIIAAVNGYAMGGGFETALACDLIIASETAVFGLPEPRVGLAALGGGLHRLPREIGVKAAMGMILTGRHVTAAEGKALGFVNEVVPPEELMAAARRWAAMILEMAPLSVRASKQAVYRGLDAESLEEAMVTVYPATAAMLEAEDLVEGPKAFAEKRAPRWAGR